MTKRSKRVAHCRSPVARFIAIGVRYVNFPVRLFSFLAVLRSGPRVHARDQRLPPPDQRLDGSAARRSALGWMPSAACSGPVRPRGRPPPRAQGARKLSTWSASYSAARSGIHRIGRPPCTPAHNARRLQPDEQTGRPRASASARIQSRFARLFSGGSPRSRHSRPAPKSARPRDRPAPSPAAPARLRSCRSDTPCSRPRRRGRAPPVSLRAAEQGPVPPPPETLREAVAQRDEP